MMTIVQVTLVEGGEWYNVDWDAAQHFISDYPSPFFAAIRFGDNIYDFMLVEHNKRAAWFNSAFIKEGAVYREPYISPWRRI